MKRSFLLFFTVALVLLSTHNQVQAQSQISGELSGTLAEDLYLVIGDIWVAENQSLTIESGAILRFTGAYSFLIDGTLLTDGTAVAPVTFTDTNNEWLGLTISPLSFADTILRYTIVENSSDVGVGIIGSAPVIFRSTMRNNAGPGLSMTANAGAVQVFESKLIGNGGRGIVISGNSSVFIFDSLIEGNSAEFGAGMAVFGGFADVLGVSFVDNAASGFDMEGGGGLYVNDATMNVSDCSFIGNSAYDDDDGGNGGAIHAVGGDINISNSVFENNSTEAWDDGGNGGAIYANGGNHYISHCDFIGNTSTGWQQDGAGAAIMLENFANSQLNFCRFENNVATGEFAYGGAVALFNGDRMDLIRSTFSNNYTDVWGGAVYTENSTLLTATNSTFYDNTSGDVGAAIYVAGTPLELTNTLISDHDGIAVYADAQSSMGIGYSDFYGPTQTAFGGTVAPGLGDIVQTNNNGDPCDPFYNIYLDPLLINGSENDLRILPGSPCVDAGDPDLGNDPDDTIVDIGRNYLRTGELDLVMELVQPILEPEGGTIVYNARLTSYAASAFSAMRYASRLELPDGTILPQFIQNVTFPLGPWQIASAEGLELVVPSFAPSGFYTLTGYVGLSPSQIADSDFIVFMKPAPALTGARPVHASDFSSRGSWNVADPFITVETQPAQPGTYVLHPATPNPFNPATQLTLDLPATAEVSLRVFDVLGRQVARLQQGALSAGSHSFTFDGGNLSSGLYFVVADAGRFGQQIQKITLLK